MVFGILKDRLMYFAEPIIGGAFKGVDDLVRNIDHQRAEKLAQEATAQTLENCDPIENHLYADAKEALCDALKRRDLQDSQDESRSSSSVFVEGFQFKLPRHRRQNEVEGKKENKCSTPSADSLLDSTKCYGHREAYNIPREVTERFEASAVSKLVKHSLRNPRFKKEYARVQKSMKEGIHPINVGYKSAFVSSDKVLIK